MNKAARSLNLLKILLAISWWGTLLATVLVIVLGALLIFDPGGNINVGLIGYAGSVESSSLSATTRDGLMAKVEFHEPVRLDVELPAEHWQSRRGLIALAGIVTIAALGLFLYFLHLLRQIVISVEEGNPFVYENAKRLRKLGILILMGAVAKTVSELSMSGYADAILIPQGFNLNGHISVDFTSIIAGLSVIVLSEVFRVGAAIREDQDLTI